jgi:predicted DNA-binding WGR domain protein
LWAQNKIKEVNMYQLSIDGALIGSFDDEQEALTALRRLRLKKHEEGFVDEVTDEGAFCVYHRQGKTIHHND